MGPFGSLVLIENDRLTSGFYVGTVHLRDYSLHHLAIEAACVRCGQVSTVNRVALLECYGELQAFDSRSLKICGLLQMAAPGTINGRVPSSNFIRIGAALGLALIASLVTWTLSVESPV
jgi:hypothetical protein